MTARPSASLSRGYGCMTCIGNSGPLKPEISAGVQAGDVIGTSVLSGNRNFEGRVHPQVKMNFLASPPLVVAYALAGTTDIDLNTEPLGTGSNGQPVFLKDIWPSPKEVAGHRQRVDQLENVQQQLRQCVRRRRQLAEHQDSGRQALRLAAEVHLRAQPALLRRHDHDAEEGRADQRRTRARAARRFGHHGPHLAGGRYRPRQPGCEVPRIPGRAEGGLQLLRRSPWQS